MKPATIIITFFLILVGTICRSQLIAPERAAMNNLEKKKWDRAGSVLRKAMKKDSTGVLIQYVSALYFFSAGNPGFQVDSAYHYATRAFQGFVHSPKKEQDRMKRFPADSVILLRLREQIDSAAFALAAQLNTEDAYQRFLLVHTQARQRMRAIELRDEVAYVAAMRENTYQAFAAFLGKYPEAARAREAKRKYERLLFETKTADKKQEGYEKFLREYPSSPYRAEAERNIFELMTAGGNPAEFISYLKRYPQSAYTDRARGILYHILKEEGEEEAIEPWLTDSLATVISAEKTYLIPFFKDGHYGFLDQTGKEVVQPVAKEIPAAYLCGNLTDDILLFSDKVVSRNGTILEVGDIQDVDDIGYGFLRIWNDSCMNIVHKSGAFRFSCVDDSRIIGGIAIATKKGEQWSLHTLAGTTFPFGAWDDIFEVENAIALVKNNKTSLIRSGDLGNYVRFSLTPKAAYDEVKPWSHHRIWFSNNSRQGILDASLNIFVKPDQQQFMQSSQLLAKTADGFRFFDARGLESAKFTNTTENGKWVAVKTKTWRLYDPSTAAFLSAAYDTITFTGPFAVARTADSVKVFLAPGHSAQFPASAIVDFIPGKDSTSFLVIADGERKTVFSQKGQRLFSEQCTSIQYAGSQVFIVEKKNNRRMDRKGLISASGKMLLPAEYDAIGSVNNDVVSLLKEKKFGLFDCKTLKHIEPKYSRNVNRYSSRYLTTYNGKGFGFLTWDSKPASEFMFEEIKYWNDSVSWVKKDFQWMLYNIAEQKIVEDKIRDFTIVAETATEKTAIVHTEGYYGVISSLDDEIIAPTLSKIVNVGSSEVPLYFTAKHVEEADIYVVIYYDKNGALLRRQVYEEDDYERILCPARR